MFKKFETEFTIDVSSDKTYTHRDLFHDILIDNGIGSDHSFSENLTRRLFADQWKKVLKDQVPAGRYRIKTTRRGLSLSASVHPTWL